MLLQEALPCRACRAQGLKFALVGRQPVYQAHQLLCKTVIAASKALPPDCSQGLQSSFILRLAGEAQP